jgi:hypothetical protein
MNHKSRYISTLVLGAAAVTAIAAAPAASAAPACVDSGGSTICQTPGNAQITTDPTGVVPGGLSSYGPFFVYDRPPIGR